MYCTLNYNGQNDRLHNDCRQLTFNKITVGKITMAEITNGKMTVYEMCVDEMTVDQKRCCPENYFERCELTIDSNLSFGQFNEANLQLA